MKQIVSLTGLVAHTTLSPSRSAGEDVLDTQDRFTIKLLRELYREVRFYYFQSKKGSAIGNERLSLSLKGMVRSLRDISPTIIGGFFNSIAGDTECYWFLISTFTGYEGVTPDYFRQILTEYLVRSNLLSRPCKSALIRSQSSDLSPLLRQLFQRTTLAVQSDLLEVLYARGGLEEIWSNQLQEEADSIIKSKLERLQFAAESENPDNR